MGYMVVGKGEKWEEDILTPEACILVSTTRYEISFRIATECDLVNSVLSSRTEVFFLLGLDLEWEEAFGLFLGRGALVIVVAP